MTSYQPFIPSNIWRFVKTNFVIESLTLSEDCFTLRTLEKEISFIHSSKVSIKDQLIDVHNNLLNSIKRKVPCIYLSLDTARALVDINEFEACIKFCAKRYPHISLYYEQGLSQVEILEIKTTLVELSELFIVKDNNNHHLEYKGFWE